MRDDERRRSHVSYVYSIRESILYLVHGGEVFFLGGPG